MLAPNARLRALVVPQEPEPAEPPVAPEPSGPAAPLAEHEANCAHHRPARLSWARLLERVFEIDMEHCPNCGGELKFIAAILRGEPVNGPEDRLRLANARASVPWQPVIEKILTHLGLQARAPSCTPAREQALQAA